MRSLRGNHCYRLTAADCAKIPWPPELGPEQGSDLAQSCLWGLFKELSRISKHFLPSTSNIFRIKNGFSFSNYVVRKGRTLYSHTFFGWQQDLLELRSWNRCQKKMMPSFGDKLLTEKLSPLLHRFLSPQGKRTEPSQIFVVTLLLPPSPSLSPSGATRSQMYSYTSK